MQARYQFAHQGTELVTVVTDEKIMKVKIACACIRGWVLCSPDQALINLSKVIDFRQTLNLVHKEGYCFDQFLFMTLLLIIILVVWELYWTARACWCAAKRDDRGWFLFFLIVQLFGIPEMIYLQKYRKSIEKNFQEDKEI